MLVEGKMHCCGIGVHEPAGEYIGPVCFRFSQTRLDYNLSEDFLASRFSLLVVQISEAAYHISENRWK